MAGREVFRQILVRKRSKRPILRVLTSIWRNTSHPNQTVIGIGSSVERTIPTRPMAGGDVKCGTQIIIYCALGHNSPEQKMSEATYLTRIGRILENSGVVGHLDAATGKTIV